MRKWNWDEMQRRTESILSEQFRVPQIPHGDIMPTYKACVTGEMFI